MTLQITQYVVTAVALTVFGVLLLLLAAPWLYGKLRRCGLFFVFIAAGFLYSMATKPPTVRVHYDGGIKPGATANVVTNDTVAIYWQRDTSGGVYVPESATVYIDYRPNTETNAEWGLLAQTTVGAWGWSGTVENATNYDYNVWAYYIPPEPVHTNGVWTYKTHFDRNGEYALPLRARVEVNGVAIATPAEKRKDAEKLPYDAEVEYLESTGTQYVLLNETINGFEGVLLPENNNAYGAVGNWNGGARANTIKWATVQNRGWIVTNESNTKPVYSGNLKHDLLYVTVHGIDVTIDGVPYTLGAEWGWHSQFLLFGCVSYGSTSTAAGTVFLQACKIGACKLYRNNVLVRDFIPVRVGTVGAMYDKRGVGGMNPDGTARNDGLYFNRGTGNFGYGNDK